MATKKIGAKIVLDGESEFRSAIRNSQSALKSLDSELKLTSAQFKNQAQSMEALKSKQAVFVKQQEQLTKQEKQYVEMLQKAQKSMNEAKTAHAETAKNITTLKDALAKAKTEYGENSTEAQKLTQELEEQQRLYAQEERSLSNLENKMNQWQTSLNQTRTALENVNQNLREVDDDIENFDKGVDSLDDSTEKASKDMMTFGDILKESLASEFIIESVKAIVNGLKDMAIASIDAGMAFEKSMSNVEALSGASGDELQILSDKAKEMGESTMFSASQSADAFGYMALAGWNVEQMLDGIEPVLALAAASNMDLAQASDIVTDSLTAFGLKAEDAGKLSDMMAYAMANSNTSAQQLGEAYKNVASTAGSMGISVEEVTAVLSTMANAGVKGGEAGTALNAIMTRLATDTKGCASTLAEYGVAVYDAEGNMNSLSSILEGTSKVFNTLTQEEQANLSKMLAGTSHYSAFQTIMAGVATSVEDGAMGFADYQMALENCDGSASKMADTMQNNLQGKLTIMQSALEGLKISFYEVFDDSLKKGVDGATESITRLNQAVKSGDMNLSLQRLNASLDKALTKLIDWAEKALPKIIDGFSMIIDHADVIGSALKGIVAGFIAFKTASAVVGIATAAMRAYKIITEGATIAQVAMNLAAKANPYVLLATAIVGVTVAVSSYINSIKEEADEFQKASEQHKAYLDTLADEKAKREEVKTSRETEKATIEGLERELLVLNNATELSNEQQMRMRQIVDELNQSMPELNLAIDEQGRLYGGNNEKLKQTIDSQKKLMYLQYAQEDINEIIKTQYDLDKEHTKTLEDKAKAEKNALYWEQQYTKALDDMNENGVKTAIWIGDTSYSLGELETKYESAKATVESYDETLATQEDTLNGLNDEYEKAMNKLDEYSSKSEEANGNASSSVSSSVESIKSSMIELQSAYDEAKASALESINSQIGLFDELNNKSDLTISDMKKRFEGQSETIGQYSKDVEIAMKLLEAGAIDNKFLDAVMEMGIDGAGYLHELVDSAQNDSDAFKETMDAWADVEDAKDNLASQLADIQTDYSTKMDEMQVKADEVEVQTDAHTQYLLSTWQKYGADVSAEMGKQAIQAEGDGKQMGENAVSGLETGLDVADGKSGKGYDLGKYFGEGFAEGIKDSKDAVEEAASELASTATTTVQTVAEIHSPSRVAIRLGEYYGEGFSIGMQDTMGDLQSIIRQSIPNEHNIKASGSIAIQSGNASKLDRLYEIMATYLPELANNRVEITANANTDRLFNFVVKENRMNTKRTGRNAMA